MVVFSSYLCIRHADIINYVFVCEGVWLFVGGGGIRHGLNCASVDCSKVYFCNFIFKSEIKVNFLIHHRMINKI